MSKNIILSIIIVNYNGAKYIEDCLNSIYNSIKNIFKIFYGSTEPLRAENLILEFSEKKKHHYLFFGNSHKYPHYTSYSSILKKNVTR